MSELVMTAAAGAEACSPARRVTRSLLGYGLVAGPFYVVVALAQAFLRPGFNVAHDDVSLLSNGDWGWVQIANFVLTGAMVIACAVGVGRALAAGRGARWAPRLLALYGIGLVLAGVFIADPMNGFPAGAPAGRPSAVSAHGLLHIVAAAVGFFSLVAACWVMGARYAAEGRPARAWFSRLTGTAFLAGFVAVASGSGSPAVVLAFWAVLLLSWSWLGLTSLDLYRR